MPGRRQPAVSVGILGIRHSLLQKHASEYAPREAFLESKECRVFGKGPHSLLCSAGHGDWTQLTGKGLGRAPGSGVAAGLGPGHWCGVPGRPRGDPPSPGRTHSANHPRSRRGAGPAPAGPRKGARGTRTPLSRDRCPRPVLHPPGRARASLPLPLRLGRAPPSAGVGGRNINSSSCFLTPAVSPAPERGALGFCSCLFFLLL